MSTRKPDATRNEALEWAMRNLCDFHKPIPKPPKGWAWSPSGDTLVLACIRRKTQHPEIQPADIIRRMFRTKGNR